MSEIHIEDIISYKEGSLNYRIKDTYEWTGEDKEHLSELINKIRAFVNSLVDGDVYREYPEARGAKTVSV